MKTPLLSRLCVHAAGSCVLLAFVIPSLARPADTAKLLPAHAHPAAFDSGWQCNFGYQQVHDACVIVAPPRHSHWECERGYRREGDGCLAVDVPPFAYLTATGHDWECQRGYQHRGYDICTALLIPADAHIDASGHDWECDVGFRRKEAVCVRVQVPEHAFPSDFLTDRGWECQRGYRQQDGKCAAVAVPANAFLDDMGHDWQCERGFGKQKDAFTRIRLPAFAHLDYSGNSWTCDAGFEAVGGRCVPQSPGLPSVAEDSHRKLDRSRTRPCDYPRLQSADCARTLGARDS